MQYKIPQDVQREDRIVGPLTLRQMIICGIGFSAAYAIFTTLGRDYIWVTWFIPVAVITLITVVFAFIKPLNLNFEKYILYALEFYLILPRKRFWLKGTGDPLRSVYQAAENKTKSKIDLEKIKKESSTKKKSISEITKILDNQN
jgi:hypothetical protein